MNFAIGKDGIASIDFTINLDETSINVVMTQPYENKAEFYTERNRIGRIFGAIFFASNSMGANYGEYSEKNITKLKKTVDTLSERSIITRQCYKKMINTLKEIVARVKIENEKETAQFGSFLVDFETNVVNPYNLVSLYEDFSENNCLIVDNSIVQLQYLIPEVCRYRGNLMKVGTHWVDLFLCEGALEHLIKSLNTEHNESKKRLAALHRGVTCFLQQYEVEIHAVIGKAITSSEKWSQEHYANYKSMVEIGRSPSNGCYSWSGTLQLFLPSRFAK